MNLNDTNFLRDLGFRLREYRQARKWTQAQLAERCGELAEVVRRLLVRRVEKSETAPLGWRQKGPQTRKAIAALHACHRPKPGCGVAAHLDRAKELRLEDNGAAVGQGVSSTTTRKPIAGSQGSPKVR